MTPQPIAIGLSFTETRRLFAALAFAAERHRFHPRVTPGVAADPCLGHPIAVADALVSIGGITDAAVLCAAVLHDVLDTTETTPQQLLNRFGREVADVVLDVSADLSLAEPVRRRVQVGFASGLSGRARLVRLADMLCRLRRFASQPPAGPSRQQQTDEAQWAEQMVEALRGTNPGLEVAADAAILALRQAR